MQKRKSIFSKMLSFLLLICAVVVLVNVYGIYKSKDYNEFIRAEKSPYTSNFTRDKEVTTGKSASYKIESKEFNDAMFYETIKVDPQTPYKVTCMVKTENVINQEKNFGGGAQISIEGTTERSNAISGTNDWQKLILYFDSKDRTEVNIGFRLGGYDNMSTGTAWFTDITCESGIADKSNTWDFVCFIFKNVDVSLQENGSSSQYRLSMSQNDISLAKENMQRFQKSCEELSKYKMQINYDIIEIDTPITSISYDEKNAYYINPTDVENLIENYMKQKEYDHIFAVVRLGDLAKNIEIPVNDWIGLGGMDYHNIGFSNIRLPNDQNSYMYRYDSNINQFPEEVFLHEFLHSLERNLTEYGYDIPALHDSEKYGYKSEILISLKNWYKDYMQKNINSNGTKIGLDEAVYTIKPVHESNFKYSYQMEIANEPQNIIEEIRSIAKNLINVFSRIKAGDSISINMQ